MSGQRPLLRNGVDLQLQSAFDDGNWPVAIRLAEKRWRTSNDPYFEIVRICCESQLDDPSAKFSAVAALKQYAQDGTVIKDVDGLDLLEWASARLLDDSLFPDTLGPLRVRCVKASPKEKAAATRCLQSCLLHWDLVNAQQIAAMIDKFFPSERSFLFWNIVITHMLGSSTQLSPEKRKLYGTLAQKQIERAAQLTEQARETNARNAPPAPPARGVQSEEEILLLYDVVETHGTAADMAKLLASPVFRPVSQFRLCRKELFVRVVDRFLQKGDWQSMFDMCYDCLSDADENDEPTLLASDWNVWKHLINSATHLRSVKPGVEESVQKLLLRLAKSKKLNTIYTRNLLLARLSAAFNLGANDEDDLSDGQATSLRLRELIKYIGHEKTSSACFDDIKGFVQKLEVAAVRYLAYEFVPRLVSDAADSLAAARLRLLCMKLQYLCLTIPSNVTALAGQEPGFKCAVCDAEFDAALCASCLTRLAKSGLEEYQSFSGDLANNAVAENEVMPGFAMVVAYCNLKLAFSHQKPGYTSPEPPCRKYLLRGFFVLEKQFHLTPKHSQTALFLVQLHLLLGSAHRAREVWEELAVKRTIADALAPIFYDRLSTVSPAVLSPSDDWGWQTVETLRQHYAASLKLRMPRRLIDAFEAGSYGSILGTPRYMENLRRSCTRAMSLVEEARAERLLGHMDSEVLTDSRFRVSDELELVALTDFGSFASWDCGACPPMHNLLQLGPGPSNTRSHLSLLAAAFHDVLDHKPPTLYKTSTTAAETDAVFVLEMMARLGNSISKFLPDAASVCTPSETLYFETISLLCALIPVCTSVPRTSTPPGGLDHLTGAVQCALDTLCALATTKEGVEPVEQAVLEMSAVHETAILRDTAVAVRLSADWIAAFNERERERDRSGNSCLHKDVMALVKGLGSAAKAALAEGKARTSGWKGGAIEERDFVSRLKSWVFDDEADGGLGAVIEEGTVLELVRSWRSNIAGWQRVKWE